MGEDDRVIILERLGYDPDDIIDRNLTIERDGDELVVVDVSGYQVARHAEPEGVCDVDLDALDVELPRGFGRDWTCLANAAPTLAMENLTPDARYAVVDPGRRRAAPLPRVTVPGIFR